MNFDKWASVQSSWCDIQSDLHEHPQLVQRSGQGVREYSHCFDWQQGGYQGQEGQGQIHLLPPQEEPPPVLWHLCQVQCQWLLKVVVGHGRDVIILALLSLHKGPFTYYVSRWRGEEGKPKADHCWRGRVSQMLTIADKGGCGSEKFSTKGFYVNKNVNR